MGVAELSMNLVLGSALRPYYIKSRAKLCGWQIILLIFLYNNLIDISIR